MSNPVKIGSQWEKRVAGTNVASHEGAEGTQVCASVPPSREQRVNDLLYDC